MKHLLIIFCVVLLSTKLIAQYNNLELPASINKNGDPPDKSAILDVQSNNQGFLMPRLTTLQREAINNPAEGLMVFDLNTGSLWYYFNAGWHEISIEGNKPETAGWHKQAVFEIEQTPRFSNYFNQGYYSAEISGNYAIVGAHLNINGFGSAHIYHKSDNGWEEQAILLPDTSYIEGFGISVDISSDYAIVGAWFDDLNGFNEGAAYIFRRTGTNWIKEAKITNGNYSTFGSNVSISGNYAIIGSSSYSFTDGFGTANIYKRLNGNWTKQVALTDGVQFGDFGNLCSISGDYAIVGNPSTVNSTNKLIYIYHRLGDQWIEQTKLAPNDSLTVTNFGISAEIYDDYAIVGALEAYNSISSAYVFQRTGSSWTQQAKLSISIDETAFGYEAGTKVSISKDNAIISNYSYNNPNGSVHIFQRNGSNWSQQVELLPGIGAYDHNFGYSVATFGNNVITTAVNSDYSAGIVYFFGR